MRKPRKIIAPKLLTPYEKGYLEGALGRGYCIASCYSVHKGMRYQYKSMLISSSGKVLKKIRNIIGVGFIYTRNQKYKRLTIYLSPKVKKILAQLDLRTD